MVVLDSTQAKIPPKDQLSFALTLDYCVSLCRAKFGTVPKSLLTYSTNHTQYGMHDHMLIRQYLRVFCCANVVLSISVIASLLKSNDNGKGNLCMLRFTKQKDGHAFFNAFTYFQQELQLENAFQVLLDDPVQGPWNISPHFLNRMRGWRGEPNFIPMTYEGRRGGRVGS